MSYPGPSWRPTQSSAQEPPASLAALREWLALCDHITRAGGRIFVIDPPELSGAPPQPELVYTARMGALFSQAADGAVFLLNPEGAVLAPTLEGAGLKVRRTTGPWGGQL